MTRKEYVKLGTTKAHREYWGQFVTHELIEAVVGHVGSKNILASTDKHFNDIPLKVWDDLAPVVKMYSGAKIREYEGQISLSDCVCTAKEAARLWKESQ